MTLRGLGSWRALVLLDGVPLNDGFGGWINWGLVPDTIKHVEVVPGGGSNLYGTWAMGGVIHILTEQPSVGVGARSETRAGNLDTHSQALIGRYGNERSGLSLAYRWFHTNGFITVPSYQRGPVDRTDDSRHEQFTGTATHALTSSTMLTLSGGLFREDRTLITSFPGDSSREGKRVPNVSRQQVVIGVTLGRPDWAELTLSGRYLSRQYADDLNTQPIADFVVLDASLQKRIGKAVKLYLDAENLTDRQYIATQTGPTQTLGAPLLVLGGVRLDH